MSSTQSSQPVNNSLLNPVFIRKILAFGVPRVANDFTLQHYCPNWMYRPSTLDHLLERGSVCEAWKETVLEYSIGTCLTSSTPKSHFNFQQLFFKICQRYVALSPKASAAAADANSSFKFDHSDFLISILRLLVKEWCIVRRHQSCKIIKKFPGSGNETCVRLAVYSNGGEPKLLHFLFFDEVFKLGFSKNKLFFLDLEIELELSQLDLTCPAVAPFQYNRHKKNIIALACEKTTCEETWKILIEGFLAFARKKNLALTKRRSRQIGEKDNTQNNGGNDLACLLSRKDHLRGWIEKKRKRASIFEEPNLLYRFVSDAETENSAFENRWDARRMQLSHDDILLSEHAPSATSSSYLPLALACYHENEVAVKALLQHGKCDPSFFVVPGTKKIGRNSPLHSLLVRKTASLTKTTVKILDLLIKYGNPTLGTDSKFFEANEVISNGVILFSMNQHRSSVGTRAPGRALAAATPAPRTTPFHREDFNDPINAAITRTIIRSQPVEFKRALKVLPTILTAADTGVIVFEILAHLTANPNDEFFEQRLHEIQTSLLLVLHRLPHLLIKMLFDFQILCPQFCRKNAHQIIYRVVEAAHRVVNGYSGMYYEEVLNDQRWCLKELVLRGQLDQDEYFINATQNNNGDSAKPTNETWLHRLAERPSCRELVATMRFMLMQIKDETKRKDFLNVKSANTGHSAIEVALAVYSGSDRGGSGSNELVLEFLARYCGANLESNNFSVFFARRHPDQKLMEDATRVVPLDSMWRLLFAKLFNDFLV